MKWFTLNISESRDMGRSLSTLPSIQRCGDGSQGVGRPVCGSFAKSEVEVKRKGTEQDAATADQMRTFGAET